MYIIVAYNIIYHHMSREANITSVLYSKCLHNTEVLAQRHCHGRWWSTVVWCVVCDWRTLFSIWLGVWVEYDIRNSTMCTTIPPVELENDVLWYLTVYDIYCTLPYYYFFNFSLVQFDGLILS
jgi:hypothetical protein